MLSKLGMQHLGLNPYKLYMNDDPGLTLTYFMARSNKVVDVLHEEYCYEVFLKGKMTHIDIRFMFWKKV